MCPPSRVRVERLSWEGRPAPRGASLGPRIPAGRRPRSGPDVAVVVATRNRADSLLQTLARLVALPEAPPIVVVDNASSDDSVARVRGERPEVELIALSENLGPEARTLGARHAGTSYVAFSDDDSWWAPGALARACSVLDAHPRLGLVAAKVLAGPDQRLDPVCGAMAASPLDSGGLPGPAVLGFVACGSVVRRSAFLSAGGFEARFGIGGEEELLALDLAAAGWDLCYIDDVVAHHHPAPRRSSATRRRLQARNALWSAWLRCSVPGACVRSARLLRAAARDPARMRGCAAALKGIPWIIRERRPVPEEIERALMQLTGRDR